MLTRHITGNLRNPETLASITAAIAGYIADSGSHVELNCYEETMKLEDRRPGIKTGKTTIVLTMDGGSGEVVIQVEQRKCCGE
jgi:hypothetical protein